MIKYNTVNIRCMLFILLCPGILHAGATDGCSDPDKYTIDRRCYVSASQRSTPPYSSVVALIENGNFVYCTGTIVRHQKKLYMITARHCAVDRKNIPYATINIKTSSGKIIAVHKHKLGDNVMDFLGDWAVYTVPESDEVPHVQIARAPRGSSIVNYDVRVIGHGALRVMSDTEIGELKEKYVQYLKEHNPTSPEIEEMSSEASTFGVYMPDGASFIRQLDSAYRNDILRDTANLKESRCRYSSDGILTDCQAWSGNSGGGVFNVSGDTMGVMTHGSGFIGGRYHAESVGTVNLLGKDFQGPDSILFN